MIDLAKIDYDDLHSRTCATAGPVPFPCDCNGPITVAALIAEVRQARMVARAIDALPAVVTSNAGALVYRNDAAHIARRYAAQVTP